MQRPAFGPVSGISRRRFIALSLVGASSVSIGGWLWASASADAKGGDSPAGTVTDAKTAGKGKPSTNRPAPIPLQVPGKSLQRMIDAAPAGSTISVPPGTYREMVRVTKPITLAGQPGAEIRGSDVWTGWRRRGAYWVRSGLPKFPANDAPAAPGSNGRCRWPEQVFFDGQPLLQVASSPVSGQFAVDSARTVILADNPTGHLVEVTTRQRWIIGEADNVTIQGFAMRHAASPPQLGAIQNNEHANWIIRDNQLSDAASAAIFCYGGSNLQLLDNDISYGGQTGVSMDSVRNVVMRGNTIHHNNTEEFDTSWEAGGVKITHASNLVVDGNTFSDNRGAGLWLDMACFNVEISNNRAHHNSGTGISYEISGAARIAKNVCWENGWAKPDAWTSAGILLNNSTSTEVSDNVVAWNPQGISILSQERDDAPPTIAGDYVHGNYIFTVAQGQADVRALAWRQDWDGPLFAPESNNRAEENAFWPPSPTDVARPFRWAGTDFGPDSLAEFAATPGGRASVYLSNEEKDRILSESGVPLQPETH